MSVPLFQEEKLLDTAVDIVAFIIPGIIGIMLEKITNMDILSNMVKEMNSPYLYQTMCR